MGSFLVHLHSFGSALWYSLPVNDWSTEDWVRNIFGLSLLPCFLVALLAPKRQKVVGKVVGLAFVSGAIFVAYTTGVDAGLGHAAHAVVRTCYISTVKCLFDLAAVIFLGYMVRLLPIRFGKYLDFHFENRSEEEVSAFINRQLSKGHRAYK